MTAPAYERFGVTVYAGDCLDVLRELPEASVHAVVTDPPYGIGFMGHQWDQPGEYGPLKANGTPGVHRRRPDGDLERISQGAMEAGRYDLSATANQRFQQWCTAWTTECLRVLKPGGHLLTFGGSRTWHRLAAAVEDAGFEVRDSIAWLYASGFPKSLDVSKALDKAAGVSREVVGLSPHSRDRSASSYQADDTAHGYIGRAEGERLVTAPATDAAREWQGWGTALKPAFEPIVVARKPLAGTVAGNVLEHGVGALNINACRVGDVLLEAQARGVSKLGTFEGADGNVTPERVGRWPSNVVITHAATPDGVDLCGDGCVPGCPVRDLDEQAGVRTSGLFKPEHADNGKAAGTLGAMTGRARATATYGDSGGASRFFPVFRFEAKAPPAERPRVDGVAHPTVKPLALMRWLVRLVTPPNGRVLDLFGGSGTTGHACRAEGFECVLIERDETYLPLIRARLDGDSDDLFGGVA